MILSATVTAGDVAPSADNPGVPVWTCGTLVQTESESNDSLPSSAILQRCHELGLDQDVGEWFHFEDLTNILPRLGDFAVLKPPESEQTEWTDLTVSIDPTIQETRSQYCNITVPLKPAVDHVIRKIVEEIATRRDFVQSVGVVWVRFE